MSRRDNKLTYLSQTYSNMNRRCNNPSCKEYKTYGARGIGLIVTKDDFIEWSLNDPEFSRLWDKWVESDHLKRFAPSIDRVHNDGDYTLDNMQWLFFGQNCRKRSSFRKQFKPYI